MKDKAGRDDSIYGWRLREWAPGEKLTFLTVPVLVLDVSSALSFAGPAIKSKPMPDGKRWMTENLNLETPDSYCS
jgi:hypothetical protein